MNTSLVHCRPIIIEDFDDDEDILELIEFEPRDSSKFGTFRGKIGFFCVLEIVK